MKMSFWYVFYIFSIISFKQQNKMGENQSWSSIVLKVQQANLQLANSLKKQHQQLNRLYLQNADQERLNNIAKRIMARQIKREEKQQIQEQVKKQREMSAIVKRANLMRQKKYADDNLHLFSHHLSHKQMQPAYKQHPFVHLVDQQDKRNFFQKQQMKIHNNINMVQQQMKKDKINKSRNEEKQMRLKYIDFVQNFYQKRSSDRNEFKSKYLKLSNPQKQAYQDMPKHNTISLQQQYNQLLVQQIRQKQAQKYSKRHNFQTIDKATKEINRRIDHPDSSPAFLGRIPMQHDRKKQLQYLQKGLKRMNGKRLRIKTQGDVEKYNTLQQNARDLPSLEKNIKNSIAERTPVKSLNKQTQINTQNIPKRAQVQQNSDMLSIINKKLPQPANLVRQSKAFLSYDIIVGKHKMIHI